MSENTGVRRVLVTGAGGFIGRKLVARLMDDGWQVRALALPDERMEGFSPAVEIVRGDVTDPASIGQAMSGMTGLVHLAAVVTDWAPRAMFEKITVGGTRNVLTAAAPGTRVVLVSSIVAYGDALGREVCDEDHPFGRPQGNYGWSKQQQETIAWELAKQRNLQVTIVRPANVYGPGSKPWVHDLAAQLRSGLPSIISGGKQNAGLCHVDNVVDVLARALSRQEAVGRTYNACDGSDVTWEQYLRDLAKLLGAAPPKSIPWIAAKIGAYGYEAVWSLLGKKGRPALTHEALNLVGSHHRVPIDRARRELGYTPKVSYEVGLKTVAEYVASIKL
jgi:2-alkyl-3-oxoalkanoate reductase